MTLPKAVQRELAAAEALQAQLVAPAPALAEETQAAPAPVAVAPTPPAPPAEDWEHRFRTLQGKYNAEVPAAKAQAKALEGQVIALTQQVQALAQAAQQAKPPEKPQIDPRDVEQFGADLVEMVRRNSEASINTLRRDLAEAVGALEQRVKALEGNVSSVAEETAQTKEATFYKELGDKVPRWREINDSARFHAWLGEIDPVYGVPRQAALSSAHERLDHARVVAIFQQFEQLVAPAPSLENQMVPRTTNSAPVTPPTAQAQRIITTREIDQFYRDQARGRFNGKPEEAARIEAEINAAIAEGRVVNVG